MNFTAQRLTVGAFFLTTIIGISLTDSSTSIEFNTKNINVVGVTNLLLIFALLALLIESACEVAVNSLTALGLIPAGDKSNPTVQGQRALASTTICWVLAMFVTQAGLRLIEAVLKLVAVDGDLSGITPSFAYIDVVLTVLILSGGSDNIHKIIKRFRNGGDQYTPQPGTPDQKP